MYKRRKLWKTNIGGESMILVFILLGIIIFSITIFIIILLSTIQIEIVNLKIASKNVKQERNIKDDYQIKIKLYFLEKIPILVIKLDKYKLRKIYENNKFNNLNINFKKIENKIKVNRKEIFDAFKKIKIRISKLSLKINIGTEDAILTSYIVAILASFIGIILPHLAKENINKCEYIVNPKYMNRNEYYICLESIIKIKIVHIIYSMLFLIEKGRDKNERTSNRRSYAYRYE